MESSKRINVNLEEREFVRLDAIRASRQEKWQSLMSRLLSEWASTPSEPERPPTHAPPGMRAISIPASLPEEYVALLENAARQMADAGIEALRAAHLLARIAIAAAAKYGGLDLETDAPVELRRWMRRVVAIPRG